jgi:hypothetical protein
MSLSPPMWQHAQNAYRHAEGKGKQNDQYQRGLARPAKNQVDLHFALIVQGKCEQQEKNQRGQKPLQNA